MLFWVAFRPSSTRRCDMAPCTTVVRTAIEGALSTNGQTDTNASHSSRTKTHNFLTITPGALLLVAVPSRFSNRTHSAMAVLTMCAGRHSGRYMHTRPSGSPRCPQ
jgi:hypothetical protein